MFFFGSAGTKSEVVGEGYELDCPRCHNVRRWPIARSQKQASVFFVPVARWGREYWMYCPICSNSVELSEPEANQVLASSSRPIPALRDELIRRAGAGALR